LRTPVVHKLSYVVGIARFTDTDEFAGAEFAHADLSNVQIFRSMMSDARLRAVYLNGTVIEAAFLDEGTLHVNGVDVVPLIEAELERRNPGRELRHSTTPEGLQQAWAAVESTWATTLDRVADMPPATPDLSVHDEEWTFSQTLRHLVFAIDAWLRKGILDLPAPFHPFGQPHGEAGEDGFDMSQLTAETPDYADVVAVFRERQQMVREFLSTVTADQLAERHPFVWAPEHELSVLQCVHVMLHESWEHHRYAVRDLDAINAAEEEKDA
jgi:hypothetical protein